MILLESISTIIVFVSVAYHFYNKNKILNGLKKDILKYHIRLEKEMQESLEFLKRSSERNDLLKKHLQGKGIHIVTTSLDEANKISSILQNSNTTYHPDEVVSKIRSDFQEMLNGPVSIVKNKTLDEFFDALDLGTKDEVLEYRNKLHINGEFEWRDMVDGYIKNRFKQ